MSNMWPLKYMYEAVIFLTLSAIVSHTSSVKPGIHVGQSPVHIPCPQSCECQFYNGSSSISCNWNPQWKEVWMDISSFLARSQQVDQLSIHGGMFDVPVLDKKFHSIRLLNFVNNNLKALRSRSFYGLESLIRLDLSYNSITQIEKRAFDGLYHIRYLNLSHNKVQMLPTEIFHDMALLEIVNLGNNMLQSLPQDIFQALPKVEVIDLRYNHLSYLTSVHFNHLDNLKQLNLAGNKFRMFHYDLVSVFLNIPGVDLSGNPFDCSCAISALRNAIDRKTISSNHSMVLNTTYNPRSIYSSDRFRNLDKYFCLTPRSVFREPIMALNTARLSCAAPTITNISKPLDVLTHDDLYLVCEAFGYPSPAIVWNTPWGNQYAHHRQFPLLGDDGARMDTTESYTNLNGQITRVAILQNGTLHISTFQGHFVGNFTCFAIGPSGNDSSTVYVGVISRYRAIYIESLFISVYCSGGFIVFSCIVGTLRMLIRAAKRKLRWRKEDLAIDDDDAETESMTKVSESSSSHCREPRDDDSDHNSGSSSSIASPMSLTPTSHKKCHTPDDNSPTGWLPGNIFETLDEARARLSVGVGRKMEMVRCQVQSMKESGTAYCHNLKTTSSVAATKMRAGMVLGVETIKYSAQSMKEFCWMGDMNGQTISMVSVSTDVDTEKRTEVFHSVTFV